MLFTELGLNETLLSSIARVGYTSPTPIQQKAIPAVLKGEDVLAAAQTGTGKTAAFTLPILELLQRNDPRGMQHPRALVLTPTRELAAQVAENVDSYGKGLNFNSTVIFGGVSPVPQIKTLRRGVDILIATPGRLLDLMQQGHIDLSFIEIFVLDEADRMLDMGFIHDIRKVIAKLPAQRQNLLFSATFSNEIRQLSKGILHNAVEVDVAPRNAPIELITQRLIYVAKHQKRELLSWLIGSNDWHQVLVFTRTKHGANRLCEQLGKDGLTSAALHGNKSQGARTKALQGFKDGKIQVLVATDIAARGLDIDQLPHVINYELPNIPADYVHRIGRTGRAGTEGEALSLVCQEERGFLSDIQKLLGKPIPEWKIEEFYLQEEKATAPLKRQHNGQQKQGRGRQQANKSGSRKGTQSGRRNQSGRRAASTA